MKILVISLARIGDLVQTTPLLAGLASRYPGCEIHVAIQDRFAELEQLVHGVARWHRFDQRLATPDLLDADCRFGAYAYLSSFVKSLECEQFDLVINLACSTLSAHICAILGRDTAGISLNSDGTRRIHGFWSYYLFGLMLGEGRRHNRINMADLFCLMGGVHPDGRGVRIAIPEKAELEASSLLSGLAATRQLVALQVGASERERCWGNGQFADTAARLVAAGADCIFVGSPAEKLIVDETAAACGCRSLAGRTSLPQLAAVLRRCDLLITNDTGTMHLAAAVGTRVVMLATGPAHHHCTGPLAAGSLSVTPSDNCWPCHYNTPCRDARCRNAITASHVADIALRALSGDTSPRDYATCRSAVCRIGRGRLCEWSDADAESLQYRDALVAAHAGIIPAPQPDGSARRLSGAAGHAARLAGLIARALGRNDDAAAASLWNELNELEGKIWASAPRASATMLLADIAKLMIEDAHATDPVRLAHEYAKAWRQVSVLAAKI